MTTEEQTHHVIKDAIINSCNILSVKYSKTHLDNVFKIFSNFNNLVVRI